MIILGIVGSIAGGKSTVARQLNELGASWIDADTLAQQALDRNDVQTELIHHFGDRIVDQDGRIDRTKLASIVFRNDQASQDGLRYLESVVHPVVRNQIFDQLRKNTANGVQVTLLDVPLLFESGWDRYCDEIWCVDADPTIRSARALARGWQPDEIAKRERRQLPISEKIALSNFVIQNDGSIQQLHDTIHRHWQRMMSVGTPLSSDGHCR